MPHTDHITPTMLIDTLSDCLLRLGRLATEVSAPEFLSSALPVVQECIPFPRGWWGMASDMDVHAIPCIHQSDYIGLPDHFAQAWQEIATVDRFADAIRQHVGLVHRYQGEHYPDLPVEVMVFDDRFGIFHAMGLALDEAASGHGFFIVLYRGKDEPEFSEQEAFLFGHLMRHLLQLWHQAVQRAFANTTANENDTLIEDASNNTPPASPSSPVATVLSPREHRVARLFARGLSYKEIARQLGLSPATVRTYLRDAYLRLGVKNKIELNLALTATPPR